MCGKVYVYPGEGGRVVGGVHGMVSTGLAARKGIDGMDNKEDQQHNHDQQHNQNE